MQYAILFFETEAEFELRSDPARAPAYFGAWGAYAAAIAEAGIRVGGAGLQPPGTATTIRIRGEKRHVQDGPFADTKEQLGGLFIVELPSLDAALDWAARSPAAAYGSVEVRPVLPPMPQG